MKLVYQKKFNHFPALIGKMRPVASLGVHKTTFEIERGVKMSMGGPRSGREYPRPGGRMHIASAPGEPPAIDYGTLVNDISSEFPSDLEGIVFSSLPYSFYLEFGTGKIAPRPAWIPAAEAAWPGFLIAMRKLIE